RSCGQGGRCLARSCDQGGRYRIGSSHQDEKYRFELLRNFLPYLLWHGRRPLLLPRSLPLRSKRRIVLRQSYSSPTSGATSIGAQEGGHAFCVPTVAYELQQLPIHEIRVCRYFLGFRVATFPLLLQYASFDESRPERGSRGTEAMGRSENELILCAIILAPRGFVIAYIPDSCA